MRQAGFTEGQALEVKVIDIDDRGKIRLSHKALLSTPSKNVTNK